MPRCALLLLLSILSVLFWIASIVLCVAIGVYVGTEDGKYTTMKCIVTKFGKIFLK